jgi:hypothetical protein
MRGVFVGWAREAVFVGMTGVMDGTVVEERLAVGETGAPEGEAGATAVCLPAASWVKDGSPLVALEGLGEVQAVNNNSKNSSQAGCQNARFNGVSQNSKKIASEANPSSDAVRPGKYKPK